MSPRVLVVDDEPSIRELVGEILRNGHEIATAGDPDEGLAALLDFVPDVLVCDIVMTGGGGRRMVEQAFAYLPDLAVVMITGHADVERFIDFFQLGVADFLTKPFAPAALRASVAKAIATRRVRHENARLRHERSSAPRGATRMLGESAPLRELRGLIARVAPSDSTVLVTGESGAGKEVVARLLHESSPRQGGPFVPVHCGALPAGLVESELFGHARGAFTDAAWPREGYFESARGGTLFLDEVGTMPEAVQVKLLRVLQERRFQRVGETTERPVDARLIAATNEDLGRLVAEGRFREDLLYRLEVFPIAVPPLRRREGDVLLIANALLEELAEARGLAPLVLSAEASRRLLAHHWPGNVRELRNVIERAALVCRDATIRPEDLLLFGQPEHRAPVLPAEGLDLREHLARLELELIQAALERCEGSKAGAAELLRVPRSTLQRRLEALQG